MAVILSMTAACGMQSTTQSPIKPSKHATYGSSTGSGATGVKNSFPRMWHVGRFTVSVHLLPKVFENGSWNFMGLTSSALYYVPKSEPTELVALANGQSRVVAKVDCLPGWQGLRTEVHAAGGSYLLVQCGNPSGKLNGILVDAKTGRTWTLWTDGQGGTDGTIDGEAAVSAGWVYFETPTTEWGPVNMQRAMDLASGVMTPLPSPLAPYFDDYLAPDGILYAIQGWKGKTAVDLYRMSGLKASLVAHLPEAPTGIDASGMVWVSKPGGSLTADAGAMTIRVWNPGISNTERTKVLGMGPGYVISLGPTPSLGANGPVRVTLDTPRGPKTIKVGQANVGNATGELFQGPNGQWQLLTVSTE